MKNTLEFIILHIWILSSHTYFVAEFVSPLLLLCMYVLLTFPFYLVHGKCISQHRDLFSHFGCLFNRHTFLLRTESQLFPQSLWLVIINGLKTCDGFYLINYSYCEFSFIFVVTGNFYKSMISICVCKTLWNFKYLFFFFRMNLIASLIFFSSFLLFCRMGPIFSRTKVKCEVTKQFVTFMWSCLLFMTK